ncbi:MAG: DUF4157 domain-containing protein [Nitrospirota bacterium]
MSVAEAIRTTAKASSSTSSGFVLQRKCACGGSTGLTGECEECKSKKLLGKPLQRKLAINEPGDEYEREADRVAEQIQSTRAHHGVSGTPPHMQRFPGPSNGLVEPAGIDHAVARSSRQPEPALRHDMAQRLGHDFSRVRVHLGASANSPNRRSALPGGFLRGRDFGSPSTHSDQEERAFDYRSAHPIGDCGRPLPPQIRSSFEEQFQTSLADVRLHDSASAAGLARWHRANALTIGRDIYFGSRRFRPHEQSGRALLAHEIAHVLQQYPGAASGRISAAEAEASAVADRSRHASPRFRIRHHVGPSDVPLRDAASLKAAIEDELDDFFVGIDNTWPQIRNEPKPERDQLRSDKVLERNIRREVDEMELLKTYLLLTYQREEFFPAHFKSFIQATDMLGTHEARIYSILRGGTPVERKEMQDMPGVVEVIEDEMSGKELQLGLQLLYGGVETQGAGVTSSRTSTHLERSERYDLNVETGEGFDKMVRNLTAATEETDRRILLGDTSLWAKLADEWNHEETWYLRMIARYGGADNFPKLTGPKAPAESFIFPIWESVKGAGTKEEKLVDTLKAVNTAPGMIGGQRATPREELLDDPWFVPMLEDELSGDDLSDARAAISATGSAAASIQKDLKKAIAKHDIVAIRTLLTDPAMAAADLIKLSNDPVILEEMGDELSGVQLCEASLLLKYGRAPLPPPATTLLGSFQKKPIDTAGAITFLQALAATAGALDALRREPGVFFMLTNSGLPGRDVGKLLGAIRSDQSGYQIPGSEGFYRTHEEHVQTRLPVLFAGTEVRIPVRCNIDRTRMRGNQKFDTDLIEDWLREIDRVWNDKFVLRDNGHSLALVFSPFMAEALGAPDITIFVMNWKGRSFVRAAHDPALNIWLEREMHLYLEDLEPKVVAHEFGHILGNPDEYALTESEYLRITGERVSKPSARGTTVKGLMGSQDESTAIAERHAAPALEVINGARDVSVYPHPFLLQKK